MPLESRRFLGLSRILRVGVLAVLIGLAGKSHASLLNLVQSAPDVTSTFIVVNYASGVFDALGTPTTFDINGAAPPDHTIAGPSSFHLSMSVVPATGALVSGSVSITGKIPALSATSGTLLTGSVTAFGFKNAPGGDLFEFKFSPTGGDLASYYGGLGGIILDAAGSNFHGTFTSAFTNDPSGFGFGVGVADTFKLPTAVPEASSLLLTAAGLGTVGVILRRRQQGKNA